MEDDSLAARALRKAPVQVMSLDRAEHHLFPPLLYQCATGILSEGKIAFPLRQLLKNLHNVRFVLAEVTGIDAGSGGGWRGGRWASRSSSAMTTSSREGRSSSSARSVS